MSASFIYGANMFETDIENGYDLFLSRNGIKSHEFYQKSFMWVEAHCIADKKSGDCESLHKTLREASRIFLLIRCSPNADNEREAFFNFLNVEIPTATNLFLSRHTGQDLAKACSLSDDFNYLNSLISGVKDTCLSLHVSCAREALKQKEYAAAMWHSRWADAVLREIISLDGREERKNLSQLREDVVLVLLDLAKAANENDSLILAKDFVNRAEVFTEVGTGLNDTVAKVKVKLICLTEGVQKEFHHPVSNKPVRDYFPNDR